LKLNDDAVTGQKNCDQFSSTYIMYNLCAFGSIFSTILGDIVTLNSRRRIINTNSGMTTSDSWGDLIGEIPQAAVYIPKASILRQNCKRPGLFSC
jgi:hypothetical protein